MLDFVGNHQCTRMSKGNGHGFGDERTMLQAQVSPSQGISDLVSQSDERVLDIDHIVLQCDDIQLPTEALYLIVQVPQVRFDQRQTLL